MYLHYGITVEKIEISLFNLNQYPEYFVTIPYISTVMHYTTVYNAIMLHKGQGPVA